MREGNGDLRLRQVEALRPLLTRDRSTMTQAAARSKYTPQPDSNTHTGLQDCFTSGGELRGHSLRPPFSALDNPHVDQVLSVPRKSHSTYTILFLWYGKIVAHSRSSKEQL